jgi:hypothetical protein
MKPFFDLSVEEMKSYGYKIVDIIAEHYKEIENKKPVTSASREEMDNIFLQEAPEKGMPADKVLNFVMDKVIPNSGREIRAIRLAPYLSINHPTVGAVITAINII